MPYVTQSRTIAQPLVDARWTIGGVPATCDTLGRAVDPVKQTTYSFRGSAEGDYSRMTGPELRRNLRSSYLSRYDTGHEFWTWKRWHNFGVYACSSTYNPSAPSTPGTLRSYVGPIQAYTTNVPTPTGASPSELDAWGREAISRTIPTEPSAGLAAMLVEMREGIPHLVGKQFQDVVKRHRQLQRDKLKYLNDNRAEILRDSGKASGAEILNWEFGYKPLANDIAKMASAVIDFSEKWEKLVQGSGEITRARASLPPEKWSSTTDVTGVEPATIYWPRANAVNQQNYFYSTSGMKVVTEIQTERDVWFSGAFTYWLSDGHNLAEKFRMYRQQADALLGATVTPDMVWQVTPWSWLADWFSDANVFFTNLRLAQADELLLRYGYIMCRTRTVQTKYIHNITPRTGSTFPRAVWSSYTMDYKQRKAATPYGFGLDVGNFSARRWSILSALGMTKSDRALRNS